MIFFNSQKRKVDRFIKDFLYEENDKVFDQMKKELLQMGEIVVEPLIKAISRETDISLPMKPIIELLGKLKDERVIKTIINLYEKGGFTDGSLNYTVATALANIGHPTIDFLINLLYDNDENTRCMAAKTLGKIGNSRPMPELTSILKNDKSWKVKFSVVEALENIGLAALDSLIHTLNDKDATVRQLSVSALGGIADKRAIEPLISLLQDLNPEVQKRAKKALEKICEIHHLDYQTLFQQAKPSTIKEATEGKIPSPSEDIIRYIKKLKELLDMRAITQEEFERKKKQLLDRI